MLQVSSLHWSTFNNETDREGMVEDEGPNDVMSNENTT
jgi:hypothetical protein